MKSTTRFISLAALFLIPVFPLIVANSYFFPFITGKAFYFRILVELAFASWVILAFLDAKYRPKLNALTVGVTIFAIVTLFADLLGVNPIRSIWSNFERMEGWLTVIHLWMFFIVATSVFGSSPAGGEGGRLWRRWLNVELVVAFAVALYGIGQLLGWFAIHQGSSRIDASLGNSAYMAVYMLMNTGIAVYLFMESKARRAGVVSKEAADKGLKLLADVIRAFDLTVLEWAYAILAVLFAYEVFETATRGTILGLIGGVMLALLLFAIFAKKENKRSRYVSAGLIGLIILVGVVFWLNRDSAFIQNNEVLGRLANISWSEAQGQARNYIWPMALHGASERPILGWGQENFNYIFNANYNPKMWSQEQWFDRAHSVYLDWLTASGVVGLAAYLSLYLLALIAIWKSDLTVAEKSALTGLGAGYAVHNIFVFDNLASYVLFFAVLGLVSSLKERQETISKSASTAVIGGDKTFGAEVVEYVVAPIAIIALVAGLYFLNVKPIEANTRLITALQSCLNGSAGSVPDPALFQDALAVGVYTANQEIREQLLQCSANVLSSEQIPIQTKQAFFALVSEEINAQIAATPKDTRIYALAGSFMNQIGAYSQAEPFLIDAHNLSPEKQSIDLELATDYLNNGESDKALAILKDAYESATDNTNVKNAYVIALVFNGKEAEAKAEFGNDPSLFNTPQMAQAYSSAKQYDKAIAIYKSLIGTSTDQVNLIAALAQTQYAAGQKSAAVATLRSIEATHPEYKDQIEAAIKQVQQ